MGELHVRVAALYLGAHAPKKDVATATGGALGGSLVLRPAGVAAEAVVDARAPIEDVVAAGGGALGGSSVLRAAGVVAEEVVHLHADVTSESRVGVAATDLVL
jgi:hypothetical protein